MNDTKNSKAAFEAWFRQKYDSELYYQARLEAWQAALASPEVQALRKDAERLIGLIKMCGHVQDGSDSVVRIFQDDATCEWIVRNGDPMNGSFFHGSSPRAAIDAAMEKQK